MSPLAFGLREEETRMWKIFLEFASYQLVKLQIKRKFTVIDVGWTKWMILVSIVFFLIIVHHIRLNNMPILICEFMKTIEYFK